MLFTLLALRNLVHSNFGRGITAIREDEVAANLTSVDTRRLKLYAFLISAFFAGVAGGLYAHLLQFINPRSFYHSQVHRHAGHGLSGRGGEPHGLAPRGHHLHPALEFLRPLGIWRWVIGPLLLVLLMIFRPQGLMGFKDARWLRPADEMFIGEGSQGSRTRDPSPIRPPPTP